MTKKYFGTDGIRGRVNSKNINGDMFFKFGLASGTYFKSQKKIKQTAIIAKDTRLSGYTLEPALVSGLTSAGMHVYTLGPLPTNGLAMLTRSMKANMGIMITASHNPYYDNGIKLFGPDGYKLNDQSEAEIEELLEHDIDRASAENIGKAKRIDDGLGRYVERVKSTFPSGVRLDGIKIVVDCANGAAYRSAPEVLWELGADVIPIGINPDGFNINHECGSTHPELAQEMVLKHRADFGVTLDGDGDRVILIDREGNILDGDDLLYILAFANPNRTGSWSGVVGTLMSNFGLEKAIQQLGYKFIRADVGDKYVSKMLTEKGWMLGGETSGHIICKDLVSTGDGTIAALKVISSLLLLERDPSEVLSNYTKMPQVNNAVKVSNKDIVNDKDLLSL